MMAIAVAPPQGLWSQPPISALRGLLAPPPPLRFHLPFKQQHQHQSCRFLSSTHHRLLRHRPVRPPPAAASSPIPAPPPSPFDQAARFQQWDSMTAKFAGAANIPFLLIQMPQIVLNAQNLLAGDKAALFAVPWLGMLTGLLGNLTLLSYFAKKKETEAIVVQTLGVVSIYVVILQLTLAGAVPLPYFTVISASVASGLVLNFLNYFNWLQGGLWRLWEDFITIAALSVLPQVMWSTFVPFVPNSILPGTISCVAAILLVVMARTRKLSEEGVKFVSSMSGWTATLLFMWMPVAQMWTTYLNPDNIKGLSAFTLLLGMIGNALMVPRALFIRDLVWFTGASWAAVLYGWGNLAYMYSLNNISREFFVAATVSLFVWIGITLWRDTIAHGYNSPMTSFKELVSGT